MEPVATEALGSSIEGAQMKRKLNRNTINLAKLSLVLKTKKTFNNGTPNDPAGSQMSDQLS